ncbi:MAG: Long-chain-fatty-acid--CoA ligase FadD13 [Syntrophaceae bacterium PtaU1.Bin231]|nr:MAG: Long-chain-fatty-acid--CoA ligase FadD13 [Syntrophaceae bacterium PtaU1.Bin231]
MENAAATNMMRRFCVGDVIRRRVLRSPREEALVMNYKGKIIRRMNYGELNREANRFANAIMALGVKKGDRVAILSHNCIQYVVYSLALSKMGAWVTPLNFALKGREIVPLIRHCEPVMFIVEDELIDTVREVENEIPSIPHRIMINLSGEKPRPEDWLDFDALCSEKYPDDEPCVEINGDDVLTLMYTSGTEATPKGVMNSHGNWYATIMSNAMDQSTYFRNSDAARQHTMRKSVGLGAAPLFHVAGHVMIFFHLFTAGRYILLHSPDPKVIMQLFQEGEVTRGSLAPAVFVNLLGTPGGEDRVRKLFGNLEEVTLYGSPASESLLRKIIEILPNCQFQNYYGLSELTPLGSKLDHDDLLRKTIEAHRRFHGAEPIGQPHSMVEMKIIDENDREVPPGTIGEIAVRSPAVMMGYYKAPEKSAEVFRGGWFHTGDLGIMDEEYYFYFVDRKKDIIKTGSENVSSVEIEQWVAKNPKCSDCTAVGLPHERWGEAVTIFVVPKPGMTIQEEEIIRYCREGLAGYKIPKRVIVLSELPKNPSGKVLKKVLREKYAGLYRESRLAEGMDGDGTSGKKGRKFLRS